MTCTVPQVCERHVCVPTKEILGEHACPCNSIGGASSQPQGHVSVSEAAHNPVKPYHCCTILSIKNTKKHLFSEYIYKYIFVIRCESLITQLYDRKKQRGLNSQYIIILYTYICLVQSVLRLKNSPNHKPLKFTFQGHVGFILHSVDFFLINYVQANCCFSAGSFNCMLTSNIPFFSLSVPFLSFFFYIYIFDAEVLVQENGEYPALLITWITFSLIK